MTEEELVVDFHKNAKRQGPGSAFETKKALNLTGLNPGEPIKIVDIGCGTGGQTLTLAENTNGSIIAVDLFPVFLEELEARASHFEDRITTMARSMDDLTFDEEEFDLIWSEGAIYLMGFRKGLEQWRPFLKVGGYLVVSEISWITHSRPKELEEFWYDECPEMDTVSNKLKVMEESGYSPMAYFVLPEYCWLNNYYYPMRENFPKFLEENGHSEAALALVEEHRREIEIYEMYKDYFSYGFYIARRI